MKNLPIDKAGEGGAPINKRDSCYRDHDICYGECRLDQCNDTPEKKKKCYKSCDISLGFCLWWVKSSSWPWEWNNRATSTEILFFLLGGGSMLMD